MIMIPRPPDSESPPPGLALVGYRGTGKSTVGRLLADRLGWPFVLSMPTPSWRPAWACRSLRSSPSRGEAAFRDEEERVLRDLTARSGLVLATGGGCILRATNRQSLRRLGFVAWLTADPTTLADRLRSDPAGRPALTSRGLIDEIADVLADRTPWYREVADAEVVTIGRNPAEVADLLLDRFDRWRSARAVEAPQ